MESTYIDRMKGRLANLRKVAAMAHDRRIIEMVTATADEIEEDIRKARDRHNKYLKELGLPPLP